MSHYCCTNSLENFFLFSLSSVDWCSVLLMLFKILHEKTMTFLNGFAFKCVLEGSTTRSKKSRAWIVDLCLKARPTGNWNNFSHQATLEATDEFQQERPDVFWVLFATSTLYITVLFICEQIWRENQYIMWSMIMLS